MVRLIVVQNCLTSIIFLFFLHLYSYFISHSNPLSMDMLATQSVFVLSIHLPHDILYLLFSRITYEGDSSKLDFCPDGEHESSTDPGEKKEGSANLPEIETQSPTAPVRIHEPKTDGIHVPRTKSEVPIADRYVVKAIPKDPAKKVSKDTPTKSPVESDNVAQETASDESLTEAVKESIEAPLDVDENAPPSNEEAPLQDASKTEPEAAGEPSDDAVKVNKTAEPEIPSFR